MIITDALACRLETAEAIDAAGCAEAACKVHPDCCAEVAGIAGGVVAFCGPVSPLTHALGVGMHGPVTVEQIAEIEEFLFTRGAGVSIDLCPHADPSLREILIARGYRIAEVHNVLVRELRAGEEWAVPVDVGPPADDAQYARALACGFFGRNVITDDEIVLGRMLFYMPCATPMVARLDGQVAGACGLSIRNKVGSFWGDATLEAFRRRGVHSALIAARLNAAVAEGCELATAGTQPGSGSQRNYQRLGFEVAYTKLTMIAPAR